jgi:hypothetical protein
VIASIVDTTAIGKVIGYSLIFGIGIVVIFGLGVSSVAGVQDALRQRRTIAGAAWGLLTVACVAATLAAVVLGIVVMSSKS